MFHAVYCRLLCNEGSCRVSRVTPGLPGCFYIEVVSRFPLTCLPSRGKMGTEKRRGERDVTPEFSFGAKKSKRAGGTGMKKHKWISAIITMILAGSLCFAMPQTVAEVVPNHSSPYSISEDESLSKAERYFGWTDPNKRLKIEDLSYFKLPLDGKEMRFIAYTRSGSDWAELYDVDSKELIVKISLVNSRNNVIQLYDYFEKKIIVEKDAEISTLDIFFVPKDKRKLAQKYFEKEDISLEEIVELMLLIDSDITSWYSNTRLPSLDNFSYTNKVPSINDEKLIEIKKFNMLYQFNENSTRTKEIDGLIVFLERNEEGNQNVFYDLFSNQKICSAENNRVLDFYPNIFEIKEKKFNNVFVENIGPVFYDYVRPLRQCIEVKDGVEYYNVGKLRKLYENLPQDKTVDYSMFLSQKPGNEA